MVSRASGSSSTIKIRMGIIGTIWTKWLVEHHKEGQYELQALLPQRFEW